MKKRFLAAVFAALVISSLQTPTQARPCADVTISSVNTALEIQNIGYGPDWTPFDYKGDYIPYTGGKLRENMDGEYFISGGC